MLTFLFRSVVSTAWRSIGFVFVVLAIVGIAFGGWFGISLLLQSASSTFGKVALVVVAAIPAFIFLKIIAEGLQGWFASVDRWIWGGEK